MKRILKDFLRQFSLSTILGLALGFALVASVSFAFTPPAQAPPGGNVSSPLHTGSEGQSKAGGLILNTGGALYGLLVDQGNVGIGVTEPTEALEVIGKIKASGYFIGYEIVTVPSGAYEAIASCPAGKKVLGGGCSGNNGFDVGYPLNSTSYVCRIGTLNQTAAVTAHAICANVE